MAEVLMLTTAERERFAAWLEQDAHSTAKMVELLNQTTHGAIVGKKMKAEAAAMFFVAYKLRSIEDMTIG